VVVFLPDACPGKSPLPTGTAVSTRQHDWRRFAVSDCGCGMRLVRSELAPGDLDARGWDAIAAALRANRGGLGDLGGGNHFLDALAPYAGDRLHLLIHTGSRAESGLVDAFVDRPAAFDAEFDRIVALVRATERVEGSLRALSHGTGRAFSRAEAKPLAEAFDFAALRRRVLIPAGVQDASLRTDGPYAYRDLDACLALLGGYVEEVERFAVVGYMGHL
jgi:hypothetical protein